MKIDFVVPLDTPSLKNQKKLARGRMYFDPEVKAFKRDFPSLVPARYRALALGSKKSFLKVSIRLFHKDWRRDADCEAIYDSLQTAGVVSNDRWIRMKVIDGTQVDPTNPRAEIEIEEL